MKFGNSVKSCWKSCASYAKKHYIMTFVMILVVILIIIYFNKDRVFENYVSQYVDAKNRNVIVSFNGISQMPSQSCCIYKVGYNSEFKSNSYAADGNEDYPLTTTSKGIRGKSGDYGWVIGITGSPNNDGTYNYNSSFIFTKRIALGNANDNASGTITVNKSKYTGYVNIMNPTLRDHPSRVIVKKSNVPYAQIYISLKFI